MRIVRPAPLALLCGLCVFTTSCWAQEDGRPLGWSADIGAGAANLPTYEGSPNRRTVPVPVLSFSYGHPSWGTFALGSDGLSWMFLDADALRAGVLLSVDTGREECSDGCDDFTSGDERLRGMGDIETTPEAGALLGYGPLTLVVRKGLGNEGHRGLIADLDFTWQWPIGERWGISTSAGARWADRNYAQTYFGVTRAQSRASGFSEYHLDGGPVSAKIDVGVEYAFNTKWRTQLALAYTSLLDEVKDSPLVEETEGAVISVAIIRHFE